MKNPLGVGVIGIGNMGIRYVKSFLQMESVKLVGICDINEKLLESTKKLCGNIQTTKNIDELLDNEEIEAVFICVNENYHEIPLEKSIRKHKHILIEKPLTDSVESGRKIMNLLEGYDKKVSVGHLLRFDPRYSGAYKAIRNGEIGDVVYITCKRASVITGPRYYGGNANIAFHLSVHDIDLIRWFVPSEVDKVSAVKRSVALKDISIDDCLLSLLSFKNGVVVQMEHSWIMPTKYPPKLDARMQIIGTRGIIDLNLKDQGLSLFDENRSEVINTSYFYERVDGGISGCLIEQLRAFITAIKEDRETTVKASDGFEAIKIAGALSEAAEIGEVVRF